MYNLASSTSPAAPACGVYQVTNMLTMSEEHIVQLEWELYTLWSGRSFARTDQQAPTAPAPRIVTAPVIASPPIAPPIIATSPCQPTPGPAPSTSSITANLLTLTIMPSSTTNTDSTLQPAVHPYTTAKENSYMLPHEQNFGSTSKGKEHEGPSYHTLAPIQNDKIALDVFTRMMKTPIVMLTSEELLSLSPKVRTKWKEQITLRRVQQHDSNNTTNLLSDGIIIEDPYETYLSSLCPGNLPKPFIAAKEPHSIRLIIMDVNGNNPVESVIDPSSSIVVMSEEVCLELMLTYDPSIHIPLESANGRIDESLGLVCNVPCGVGSIILYIQIHIICSPAYDILLGHPFDVLMESAIKNYHNKSQMITIFDPNYSRTCIIPTIPCSHQCCKVIREDFCN